MHFVEIHDSNGGFALAFDLIDILRAIGGKALTSRWIVDGVECVGSSAEELHRCSDSGEAIDGKELWRMASDISQTIDGRFSAFEGDSEQPWLQISAIDSSYFEVGSTDEGICTEIAR